VSCLQDESLLDENETPQGIDGKDLNSFLFSRYADDLHWGLAGYMIACSHILITSTAGQREKGLRTGATLTPNTENEQRL
jgi:hypothetical protein